MKIVGETHDEKGSCFLLEKFSREPVSWECKSSATINITISKNNLKNVVGRIIWC